MTIKSKHFILLLGVIFLTTIACGQLDIGVETATPIVTEDTNDQKEAANTPEIQIIYEETEEPNQEVYRETVDSEL